MRTLLSPLLVVTDRHAGSNPPPSAGERNVRAKDPETSSLLFVVQCVLEGGASWIWFRDRDMDSDARRSLACDLLRLVRSSGGTLTIGGDPALVATIGADGVHLPGTASADDIARARDLLPEPALIGVSAHGIRDIEVAACAGADYVTLSPVFETRSKPGYGPALGPDILRAAAGIGLPVIALGGVTSANAAACRMSGAAGVAMMGGLMRADDPAKAARTVLDAWG